MIYGPKKGVAFTTYLPLVTAGAADWKAAPTIAAGDWKVSKDDGALVNLTTLPTVSPAAGAWVKVVLSAAEMNADVVKVQGIDQTGTKEWDDTGLVIVTTAQGIGTSVPQTGDSYPKTVNLPPDPADASDLLALLTVLQADTDDIQAKLGAPAGASLAADVAALAVIAAAVQAKTDNLPADPADASDLLALLTVLQADTDDIQARLPAALVGGKMDAVVGSAVLAANGLSAIPMTPPSGAPATWNLDDALRWLIFRLWESALVKTGTGTARLDTKDGAGVVITEQACTDNAAQQVVGPPTEPAP